MIIVRVTTELVFSNEENLNKFLNDEANEVVGFKEEIKEAYSFNEPVKFSSRTVKSGEITNSLIECYEIGK